VYQFHGDHDQSTHGNRDGGSAGPSEPAPSLRSWRVSDGDTLKRHKPDGKNWTRERKALHERLVKKAISKVAPAEGGKPTLYMMGGGPAAGKSDLVKNNLVDHPDAAHSVRVDPDEIKGELPEYRQLVAVGNLEAAGIVHEESSHVSKRVIDEALKSGRHTVYDSTGDGSIESLSGKIAAARAAGAKRIEADYVTVPTEMAVQRALARAKNPESSSFGRLPDLKIVRETHRKVSEVLPQAIQRGLFDKVKVWESTGRTPRLIAEARGARITVHDQAAWKRFLAKADEDDGDGTVYD